LKFTETTGNCLAKSTLRITQQQQEDVVEASVNQAYANTVAPTSVVSTSAAASIETKKQKTTKAKNPAQTVKQSFARIMNQSTSSSSSSPTTTTTTNTITTATPAANTTASSASHQSHSLALASESESDTDTSDFSRLTDILQARGLPTHIVNAFGTKVQQFLSRTISNGLPSRSQQLIQSLQQPDETLKLTALSEMCQMLVMGNEDTLIGFPIKQAVPLLIQCMNTDTENFDLMNHACRALTYMMESLPRSSSIIAEGK
jgi:hypothetical protein